MSFLRACAQIGVSSLKRFPVRISIHSPACTISAAMPFTSIYSLSRGKATTSCSQFDTMGLRKEITNALESMNITTPTPIQEKAIRKVLDGSNVLCTAQTGTGKTLAFLLPIIEKLKQEEGQSVVKKQTNRPRALILTPSRELGVQIFEVAKALSHHVKFSTALITGGCNKKQLKGAFSKPVDVLVATPGRMIKYFKNGQIFPSQIKYVVVDEVDTMYDPASGFKGVTQEVLGPVEQSGLKNKRNIQYILAGATLDPKIHKFITRKYPGIQWVSVGDHHQKPSAVQEMKIRVKGNEDKHISLRNALRSRSSKRTVVFCNSMASCRSTEHMLKESGFNTFSLHGDIPSRERTQNYNDFRNHAQASILVCTDIAARGLDLANLDHVIQFDFAKTTVDYLHRIGRTGRAGRPGFVSSFVTKHDVKKIQQLQQFEKAGGNLREKRTSSRNTSTKTKAKTSFRKPAPFRKQTKS